jgi:autotransporter translocation and assembly factor TamB
MRGGNIHLAQLRVVSGGGGLTAQGWLKLARGDTRGRLRVTAKDWPVVKPGLPVMKLDANVRADLDARGTVTDIDVVVRDSFLDVLGTNVEAPAKIAFAEDVVFVDVAGKRATAADQAVDRANAKEPLLPPNFRLSLQLENAALVRGPQVDMSWDGAIELARTGDAPIRSSGALEAEHGRVAVLGNDFRIESGRITLPPEGDLDPYIDLTAQTETPEALVTMTVRGRASRPELRLSSDPAMPESQVFALLLTGRTDSAEGVDESYEAKAASLLAAFQNPALQRALQDRVGIDRVGVGFGETVEQPIFTLGKRVTRNVYVETSYHHNAPREDNEVEVRLEYMFKPPSWSVDTYFGDAAEGGIGVWWRRRFGGAKKPKEPVDEMAGPDTPRGVGRLQP